MDAVFMPTERSEVGGSVDLHSTERPQRIQISSCMVFNLLL